MHIIDEELKDVVVEPLGFEGLLLLVGLGIVISPIRIISGFISTYPPIFTDGTWDSITSMNSLKYDPYWGTLITVEIIANLVFIFLTLFLTILFFKKKATFPKWYFISAFAFLSFTLTDSYVVSWIYPATEFISDDLIRNVGSSIVSLLLWVPYLFKSERANNTFIQ